MKQEKRISYRAGITRKPSDFLCQDGELAECINLTTDNEELKPMVQPKEDFTVRSGTTLRYIHKFGDEERYICKDNQSNNLYWKKSDGTWPAIYISDNVKQITSVGKILIVNTAGGILHFLWKVNAYKNISSIPELTMDFSLRSQSVEADWGMSPSSHDTTTSLQPGNQVWSHIKTGDAILDDEYRGVILGVDKLEQFNDIARGLYSKNKSLVAQKKGFCLPFFIRYALRMYDGSYVNISKPILMCPAVTSNSYMRWYCNKWMDAQLIMFTSYANLYYTIGAFDSNYSDIVKGVDVFVSQGIDLYDMASDQVLRPFLPSDVGGYTLIDGTYINMAAGSTDVVNNLYYSRKASMYHNKPSSNSTNGEGYCLDVLKHKDMGDVLKEIGETSIFYKICSLDLPSSANNVPTDLGTHFDEHTLETLTSRDRLPDDYFSRSKLSADVIYSYNMRLNLGNVKRSLFKGFDSFLPFDNTDTSNYSFYVTIDTESGDMVVKHTATTRQKQGLYFFYPDPRATHVVIMKGSSCVLNADLNECEGLNGAFFLKGLPGMVDETTVSGVSAPSDPPAVQWEGLYNQIVTSEVDNPLVFSNKGYNKVGVGKIIGISTTTMALSQDQFGRTDLIVFTDSGLWGMQVDNTGLYESHHPLPREVCINPANITQVDGAVFFVSKKGLMVIGEDGIPRCVSEQMNGKTFNTYGNVAVTGNAAPWADIITACQGTASFLDYIRDEDCMMAYDYIDSRLLIINPDYNFAYVYNMADGTISKTVLPAAMTNVVNNYPDYLLQSGAQIYTLYGKQREEEINTRQRAFLLTRPMKFAGPLTVSSLRELVNVGMWDEGTEQTPLSVVKTVVWLSDDMRTWREMQSRFGAAARYFRIGLFINMLPTERLSGTIITEQERRTDNLRA